MTRYEVSCEWDGYNWVATIDGVTGGVTQAKRLDLLPQRIIEVVKLLTGAAVGAQEIVLHPHVDEDLDRAADELAHLESRLREVDSELTQRRRRVVYELRRRGFPLRDIGFIARVSHQRVHQLLNESGSSAGH